MQLGDRLEVGGQGWRWGEGMELGASSVGGGRSGERWRRIGEDGGGYRGARGKTMAAVGRWGWAGKPGSTEARKGAVMRYRG